MSPYFSIKLHYGGQFNSEFSEYVGGDIAYFDMCSVEGLCLFEIEAMVREVGCSTDSMDLWFLLNELEFAAANIMPIETERDLDLLKTLVESNYKLVRLYLTPNGPGLDGENWDISFTQLAIDQRIQRIEDIRVEVGEALNEVDEEGADEDEEEKQSFHGDSSNMDSSESDCPKPKKKRRVPPPNPPYRARKRGRYSMLRGLFKNTEETPVVLDEEGNDLTPKTVKRNTSEGKSSQRPIEKKQPIEDKLSQSQRKPREKTVITEIKAKEKSTENKAKEKALRTSQKSVSQSKLSEEKRKTRQKSVVSEGNVGAEQGGEEKLTQSEKKKSGEVKLRQSQRIREKSNEDKGSQRTASQKSIGGGLRKSQRLQKEKNSEVNLSKKGGPKLTEKSSKSGTSKVEMENEEEDVENQAKAEEEDDSSSSESSYDSNVERMAVSSCDEDDSTYPEFNEYIDMENPQFRMGMVFSSAAVFREAVRQHAITQQRGIRLKKNHSDKIKWVCSDGCDWKCYGIKQQRSSNIQIKTICNTHTCSPTWVQKQINSSWLARSYEHEVRMNPSWPLQAFHAKLVNDLKCNISETMAYRALRKAKETIIGKHEEEFSKLYLYANEVKKVMPTSTIKLMTEPAGNGLEERRFKRFYVMLGPLKEGFLEGCRPLIGLDGCHLKGPFGGILLTAVATDPNEGMYPLAWAHVEAENNSSWDWFLGLIKADLSIENSGTYTFISDRQKVILYTYPLLLFYSYILNVILISAICTCRAW